MERPWKDLPLLIDEHVVSLFQASTKIETWDGTKILFWDDNWLGYGAPRKLFSDLFSHRKEKKRSLRDDLL